MNRFLLLFALASAAVAQNAPNCNQQNAILSSATTGPNYNATSVKCVAWTFSYYSEGFSALSVQVEYAPDVAGAPGAFAIVPSGNIVGTNPLTNTVSGSLTVNGYFPWLRVNLTTVTGMGFINYTLIGNAYVGASSQISAGGGVATNVNVTGIGGVLGQQTMAASAPVAIASDQSSLKVNGPDANGAAPTKSPVQVAGFDGTDVRQIRVYPNTFQPVVAVPPGTTCTYLTMVSVPLQTIPTSTTTLISGTVCPTFLDITNTTAGSLTITITDLQGSPVTFLNAFAIPANSQLLQPLYGLPFTSGLTWKASGSGLTGGLVGFQ